MASLYPDLRMVRKREACAVAAPTAGAGHGLRPLARQTPRAISSTGGCDPDRRRAQVPRLRTLADTITALAGIGGVVQHRVARPLWPHGDAECRPAGCGAAIRSLRLPQRGAMRTAGGLQVRGDTRKRARIGNAWSAAAVLPRNPHPGGAAHRHAATRAAATHGDAVAAPPPSRRCSAPPAGTGPAATDTCRRPTAG